MKLREFSQESSFSASPLERRIGFKGTKSGNFGYYRQVAVLHAWGL